MKLLNASLVLLFASALLFSCQQETPQPADPAPAMAESVPEGPARWEDDIAAFEAEAAANPPPEDAYLFVGSSSIRLWSTLEEDMAPMPVIQRGFGGSALGDCIHYADRLVTPYQPKAIFVFCGTNDIAGENAKSATEVFDLYKTFVGKIREDLPQTPIYFIAITHTRSRWEHIDTIKETNALVEAWTTEDPSLHYIDTASHLLDDSGEPRDAFFVDDQLHLSPAGYEIWTAIIRPILEELHS